MNPLTGLPGNNLINQKLSEIVKEKEFSVLYIDLDFFKTYNDTYGFQNGDRLHQKTASVIHSSVSSQKKESFVGHIGGDNFIVLLFHSNYEKLCKDIISEFNRILPEFYKQEDYQAGGVFTEDRNGVTSLIPLVSISIAVISNQIEKFEYVDEIVQSATRVKKLCKQNPYSCYLTNTDMLKAEYTP